MKRILSLFLAAVVLVVSLAVPSYATEVDNVSYVNLLDFMTFERVVVKANTPTSVTYELPVTGIYYFIDIVLTSNNLLDQADFIYNEAVTPLNVVSLGNELYRVYGSVRCGLSSITLQFTNRYNANLDIKSFNLTYLQASHFNTAVEAIGSCGNTDFDLSLNWGDSRPTSITFTPTFPDIGFNLTVIPRDWYKYDFLDVVLYAKVANISSISCNKGNTVLPFTSSVLTGSGSSDGMYVITVRIDLRGLDRTNLGTNIELVFTGTGIADEYNQLAIFAASGFVLTETVNPFTYFFTNLLSSLSDWFGDLNDKFDHWGAQIVEALSGDTSSADDFVDQSGKLNNELGNISSSLDSMVVPDQGDINLDVTGFISGQGASTLAPVLASVLATGNISIMFSMSVLLMTAAYILFGKR